MDRIAIIGTAGRDKTQRMDLALWQAMVADCTARLPDDCHIVSGGAAWADHLAIEMVAIGKARSLVLYLPAPFAEGEYQGPSRSSASASNYYHHRFSIAIGRNTLDEIAMCHGDERIAVHHEPEAYGYAAMFKGNAKVAKSATSVLAYTFGVGDEPAKGGTRDTWNQVKGSRVHVELS